MRFNKMAAGLTAAAIAASAMTASASASIKIVEGRAPDFTSASGMWMVMLYKNDGAEVEIDYGLDVTKIAQMKVQFTTDDTDFFEGMFGGALVASCGPASLTPADHNWPQKNWWGVADDEAEIWTQDTEAPVQSKKIGDYTYEVSMTIDDSNCFYSESTYCQAAIMEWGQDLSQLVVLGMQFYDAAGNSMIEFDENGNANIPNLAGQAADEAPADDAKTEEEAPADDTTTDEAPADDTATDEAPADDADEDEAPADDADEDEAPADDVDADEADEDEAAPAQTEAAPAASEAAPAATEAPAPSAGSVDAATSSTKGSPDTGVADVAAVAGLAIVAAGAVVIAKKRK